jgi:hypothetical protein
MILIYFKYILPFALSHEDSGLDNIRTTYFINECQTDCTDYKMNALYYGIVRYYIVYFLYLDTGINVS